MSKTNAVVNVPVVTYPAPRCARFSQRQTAGVWGATVAPGLGIRIRGSYTGHVDGPKAFDRTFAIGDVVEYDSWNLSYTGKIVAIGAATVTIERGHRSGSKRLDLATFIWRNWDFDEEKSAKRNSEWMD